MSLVMTAKQNGSKVNNNAIVLIILNRNSIYFKIQYDSESKLDVLKFPEVIYNNEFNTQAQAIRFLRNMEELRYGTPIRLGSHEDTQTSKVTEYLVIQTMDPYLDERQDYVKFNLNSNRYQQHLIKYPLLIEIMKGVNWNVPKSISVSC